MSKMKTGKQMKRGDHEYQFTDKLACCKWFDQRSVTMLFSKKRDFIYLFFSIWWMYLGSMPSWFTIWWIKTTLRCLITKKLPKTIWVVGTQVISEHHQNKKLDQRENISNILSLSICYRIFLNFKIAENVVNTATKKYLTENFHEMDWVWYIFTPCKKRKLFFKTSLLADWKIYLFIVVFSSYSIVKVFIKQNMQNFIIIQWIIQKQSPGGVL